MAKKKRLPYLQLFTQDIRGEQTLKRCSWEARYLWREMLDFMHESPERGFLMHANGDAMTEADLADMIAGGTIERVRSCILELEINGVFSRDRRKIIYNRRMVRDQKKADTARSNGKNGGNPALKGGDKSEIKSSKSRDNSDLAHGVSPEREKEIPPLDNQTVGNTRDQRPESQLKDNKQQQPVREPNAVVALGRNISEITGWANDPRWFGDFSRIDVWLKAGYDPEADILPTIRRLMAKRSDPPQNLKYFERAIADAHASRLQPLPEGKPQHGTHQQSNPNGKSAIADAAADRALARIIGQEPQGTEPVSGDHHPRLGAPVV